MSAAAVYAGRDSYGRAAVVHLVVHFSEFRWVRPLSTSLYKLAATPFWEWEDGVWV